MSKTNSSNLTEFGGKGYSLIKLKELGVNVPEFFIITTKMFDQFLEFNNLKAEIKELFESDKFEEIKTLIGKSKFPSELEKFIFESFEKLNSKKVSVRSSAVVEDSKAQSCAGQFETFLNVTKSNLLESVKKCFASLYSVNTKLYIGDFSKLQLGIAVVVQKMINSEFSGVAFSTDYVLDNKDYMIIESVNDIGENFVSGKLTPEKFYVRKSNLSIDNFEKKSKLGESEIHKIAEDAQFIEKKYGMPMDIEWAVENKTVYILQARPIVSFLNDKVFQYTFSRPRNLFEICLYYLVYDNGFKKLSNNMFYLNPIIVFDKKVYREYSNTSNNNEDPFIFVKNSIKNKTISSEQVNKALKACENAKTMLSKFSNFKKIINDFVCYETLNNYSNFLIGDNVLRNFDSKGLDKTLKNALMESRDVFDKATELIIDYIKRYAKDYLKNDYEKQIQFLTLDEILNKQELTKKQLEERQSGFVYYKNKITYCSDQEQVDAWAKKNEFILNDVKKSKIVGNSIFGSVAYNGTVTGRAVLVFNENDFKKVKQNDIIISPMTTPSFSQVLDIVSAIVTDDGGTVCHAALLAREYKVPCIVGTKTATQFFKDGDIIEINTALSCVTKKTDWFWLLKNGLQNKNNDTNLIWTNRLQYDFFERRSVSRLKFHNSP